MLELVFFNESDERIAVLLYLGVCKKDIIPFFIRLSK